jgi:putative hydrolase of the HAD superfamily
MIKCIAFDYYKVIYIPESQEIDKDIVSILKTLKKKVPLHLFTNVSEQYVERMNRKTKFLRFFEKKIYLTEYPKPHEKAFEKLITTLGMTPSEILFIDDSLININTAQQFGIETIQYISPSDLENKLGKYINYDK